MKIRLGLQLDGQRGWHSVNRLGYATVGPLGFLGFLEAQLGLLRESVSQSARIVAYRDCLKRCDAPDRFYHRTFETDELGTAATLLGWRDLWHLHGWSGQIAASTSKRLRDLGEVENLARSTVEPGMGERLVKVLAAMEYRKPAIEQVELVDPLESFPKRWRDILACLPLKETASDSRKIAGKGFLRQLQTALRKVQAGEKVSKLAWKEDGTVKVVQAETRLLAGRWLADRVMGGEDDGLIVCTAGGALLDSILASSDGARQGFREASAFRPTLQVLPLALELIWEPLNFYGLLQFLTHPICPVPGYARRILADKLADRPGIGGMRWELALEQIDKRYKEKAKDIRKTIQLWVEHSRYSQESGAPIDEVLKRVQRLTEFFRVRLADKDRAARVAFNAGFAQCKACGAALDGLIQQGVKTLRPRQLQKLVAQATARGSENPLLEPEVGSMMGITDPAAAVEDFDRVMWWQLGMPALPSSYPWSTLEMADLESAGVSLPALQDVLERTARDWLKPILAARKELVLVLPPKGEEVHPVWLMIEALVKKAPITSLESILTEANADRPPVPHTPLPARRRWWQLPKSVTIQKKGRDSFSSLELLLFNPYQWLLKYPAALKPSRILSVSNDFRLFGNLAHHLVDLFFKQKAPLPMSDGDFLTWFNAAFDQAVIEEGAVLLIPGRRSDLEGFRIKLRESIRQLRLQMKDARIVQVQSELELTGTYAGGEMMGYADLVLAKASGAKAIVDMKWSGSKKYPEKLKENRQLQLAIYGELLRQQIGVWPAVAYYILDRGQLFALDTDYFPSAQAVQRTTDEGTPHLWLQFVETWKWRQTQIQAGKFELVFDEIPGDDESVAPKKGLSVEVLSSDYNDYLALAGWEI